MASLYVIVQDIFHKLLRNLQTVHSDPLHHENNAKFINNKPKNLSFLAFFSAFCYVKLKKKQCFFTDANQRTTVCANISISVIDHC